MKNFLDKTEPKDVMITRTHRSNLRLNIQKKLGLPANPIDILRMFGSRRTQFIIDNQALYRDCIIDTFNAYAQENMEWFSVFEESFIHKNTKHLYSHSLFNGVALQDKPNLRFKIECLYIADDCSNTIKLLSKKAENKARKHCRITKDW